MKQARTVHDFIEKKQKWREVLLQFREICLALGMEETMKWGMPVYCIEGKNVAGLGGFKHHVGIWFFNGVLLKDTHKLLENAQEGKTKAMRQLKFTDAEEINMDIVEKYLKEALKNQKEGKEVKFEKSKKKFEIPDYFIQALSTTARKTFENFSPGKQKDYIEWVTEAKTEKTREKRIEQSNKWLEEGKPRNWKYMKEWK